MSSSCAKFNTTKLQESVKCKFHGHITTDKYIGLIALFQTILYLVQHQHCRVATAQ